MELNQIITNIKQNDSFIENLPVEVLTNLIKEANQKYYYSDSPIFNDETYDLLVEKLESLDKNNKILNEVSGLNDENKVLLPYFLGSQDKIKFSKDTKKLDRWKKKYKGPYLVSDKLDGISGLLIIDNNNKRLLTRGDGKYGRDISNIIPYINISETDTIDIKETLFIRGELVVSRQNFEKYKSSASHSRNFVSGLQNSKEIDKEKLQDVDFVCYELLNLSNTPDINMDILRKKKFNVVSSCIKTNIDINDLNNYYSDRRDNSEYDIDGIVVRDNQLYKINDGNKSKNPKYSFAFKMMIEEQIGESEVVNIEWNISKDGYLIPRMEIKPINLAGATITYASCHHADYVVKNNLNIGSKVKIIRSGDVIPYVLEVIKKSSEPLLPKYNYKWNESKVDFVLVDKNIDEYNQKLIQNFFSVLKIRDLGDNMISKIIDSDKKTIKEILNISVDDLLKIEGIQNKLANKIYNNLNNRISNVTILSLMIASNCFGRGIGEKKLKIFIDLYPNFLTENVSNNIIFEKLCSIDGFHDKTVNKIIKGIEEFKTFYNTEIPVSVQDKISNNINCKKDSNISNKKYSFLENKNIVLTGTREIEKILKDNNVNIQGNVNSKTELVICKDKSSNSSKIQKAKENNIKILDLKDFYNIIKL